MLQFCVRSYYFEERRGGLDFCVQPYSFEEGGGKLGKQRKGSAVMRLGPRCEVLSGKMTC